jgi:drug/metabolite transporter (DMT)-like permease
LKIKNFSLAGFAIALLGSILFSTKAIIVKKAFANTGIDAVSLLALRMLCAAPFYLGTALYLLYVKKSTTSLTLQQWIKIAVLGLFGYYLSSLLDFAGLQYISAGLERLILFLFPTFVLLINRFYYKQPIYKTQLWAIALTYIGIAIALLAEMQVDFSAPQFAWGCLLIFCCAVTYAIYLVGGGQLIPVIGATQFTTYAMLAATFGVLLHFTFARQGNLLAIANSGLWKYGFLLAIVATVIPSFLVSLGMKKLGANNAVIVSSIGPVSTIVQAHYFLGERISAMQLLGTLLVIAGIVIIGWNSRNNDAQTS